VSIITCSVKGVGTERKGEPGKTQATGGGEKAAVRIILVKEVKEPLLQRGLVVLCSTGKRKREKEKKRLDVSDKGESVC